MSHVVNNAEETCLNKNQSENAITLKKAHDVVVNAHNAALASPTAVVQSSGLDPIAEKTEDVADPSQKHDFPEGGLHAWLVVFGSWCAQFLVFGIVNSTAVFQDYLSSNQLHDHTSGQIGWIFSLQLFLVFFTGLYVGPVFDRHGPRLLVLVGSTATVLSTILLGSCTQYWHFMLAYSILGGFGAALLCTTSYATIGHYFERRRGLATGIACTAGSLGGIIIPLMLRSLLPSIGFPWSVRIVGFMLLGLSIPANVLMRKRLPASKKPISLVPDLSSLKDKKFAFCVAGMFFMEWGLFVPLAYISSYVSAETGSESLAIIVLVALNAGSFFGRFIPGWLADRFGRFNVIIVTIALCAVTQLALWLPAGPYEGLIIVFAVLFGFVSGSNLGLIPVCLGQLVNVEDYGRACSAAYFIISFGTLTSIPIGGQILEGTGGEYWGAIVFAGVAYGVAFMCYVTTRVLAIGWNPIKFF